MDASVRVGAWISGTRVFSECVGARGVTWLRFRLESASLVPSRLDAPALLMAFLRQQMTVSVSFAALFSLQEKCAALNRCGAGWTFPGQPYGADRRGVGSEITERPRARERTSETLAALLSLIEKRTKRPDRNESDFHVVARNVASVIAARMSSTC